MTEAKSPRWNRFEQALLTALGCTGLEGQPEAGVYRLLMVPTFHAACCVEIMFARTRGRLRYAALPSVTNPISDYFWGESSAATEVSAIEEAMFSSLESVQPLADAAALQATLANLPDPTVDPRDVAARDGISLRLDARDGERQIHLQSDVAALGASPELARWISLFLDTTQAHATDPRVLTHLKKVRASLFGG